MSLVECMNYKVRLRVWLSMTYQLPHFMDNVFMLII